MAELGVPTLFAHIVYATNINHIPYLDLCHGTDAADNFGQSPSTSHSLRPFGHPLPPEVLFRSRAYRAEWNPPRRTGVFQELIEVKRGYEGQRG